MTVIRLDGVQAERVSWLWPGYIPFGYLTMLDGKGGLGKSTIMLDMAARLTRALPLPDGTQHEPMGVMLMMLEDGLEDVIRPRLDNAGADMARVFALTLVKDEDGDDAFPAFPTSVNQVEREMARCDCRVLLIDPIMNYFGKGFNTGIDSEVRQVLMPLHEMVKRNRWSGILLRHLNRRVGADASDRGQGSPAFLNLARSALVVARDPDDPTRYALAQSKTNLAAMTPTLTYRLAGCENGAARVDWEGISHYDADALVQQGGSREELSELEEAKVFLRDLLADGEMLAKEAQRLARDAGIAERTLRRARESLRVRLDKENKAGGRSLWRLPGEEAALGQNPTREKLDTLATLDNTAPQFILGQSVQDDQHLRVGTNGQVRPSAELGGLATLRRVPVAPFSGLLPCARCGVDFLASAGEPGLCDECRTIVGVA